MRRSKGWGGQMRPRVARARLATRPLSAGDRSPPIADRIVWSRRALSRYAAGPLTSPVLCPYRRFPLITLLLTPYSSLFTTDHSFTTAQASKPPTARRTPTSALQTKAPGTLLKEKTDLAVALRHGITRTAPMVLSDQEARSHAWRPVGRARRSHCTDEGSTRYTSPPFKELLLPLGASTPRSATAKHFSISAVLHGCLIHNFPALTLLLSALPSQILEAADDAADANVRAAVRGSVSRLIWSAHPQALN